MNKGEIVLVPFPFSDLSGSKLRPALILFVGNLDVTVSFISTQLNLMDEFDITLAPSPLNGLKKISVLRLSKIATLEKDLIIGKLGKIDSDLISSINTSISKVLFI